MTMQIGVVAAPHGALVAVTSEPDGLSVVTMIEELPLSVATLAERVADLALALPDAQFVVDGAGIGDALWRVLQPESRRVRDHLVSPARLPDGAPAAWLYEGRGAERQGLVNRLVVAEAEDVLRFEHGLAGFEAMQRALVSYSPSVGDDGRIGGELVSALALALLPRLVAPPRLPAFLV